MPLTKKGKEIMESFKEQYNEEKGTRYFYAYMKKHPEKTIEWHK